MAKVVVITGASAGVGRATAQAFARLGAHLGLMAREQERLNETVSEVERLGGEGLALPADVADVNQVQSSARTVEDKFGPIDIWINNAMTTIFSPFEEITPDEFRRATEVTYLGAVWGTMTALKSMLPRNTGCIIQVGSALAYRSIPLQSAYCGAKHAIKGFTDSLRTELLHSGSNVHLTMVHLPAVNTPQFDWCRSRMPRHPQPVPPIYNPEVPARAIVWSAYHRKRELYVGLPTNITIAANKIIPGLLDHYLARTGFESQQTGELADPARPDNMYQPVKGKFGAHGGFDDRALDTSIQFWLRSHSSLIGFGALLAAGLAWRLLRRAA